MMPIFLSASILSSTLIFVVFKFFDRKGVHNLSAITINYLVAAILGTSLHLEQEWALLHKQDWFVNGFFLGFIFISIFTVMARTSQIHGVSVASVSTKMSVVIPVLAAFWLYGDAFTWYKVVGLIMALAGVYLVSKPKHKTNVRVRYLYLPILLFLGSGFIDAFIKYNQETHFSGQPMEPFLILVFAVAGCLGFGVNTIQRSGQWTGKNIAWGAGLGIINYASMYFLVKTLDTGFESSVIFPINNLGIVALSALISLVGFREPLSRINWLGIALSVLAILLFAWPDIQQLLYG